MLKEDELMVPIKVNTLIITSAPGPSILVLQPIEDCTSEGKCRIVPIWIGITEATQLSIALDKAKLTRPMTHDLFLDAITNLDACVDHVLINGVKGAVFSSCLTLRQHGRLIELDARPSDAISLALRQHAPLYIDEETLEKASFPYIERQSIDEEHLKQELTEFHSFVEDVNPDDFSLS